MENNPKHLDMWESYSSSQMRSVKKMFKKPSFIVFTRTRAAECKHGGVEEMI